MLLAIPGYLGLDSFSGPLFRTVFGGLSLALALPALIYSAADYWRAAWLSLRDRVTTLDIPIALGLAAIYGQSAYDILWRHGEGYLDSLTGLIFFLLCGRLFQQKTHDRLAFDRDYKCFFPLAVTRRTATGETTVALSRLQVGDHLILRGGELLPADATLVAGTACLDYSFVTGESEPVACAVGTHLYAGGRQTGGAIEVVTVKPVSQSYLTSLWNNEIFHKPGGASLDTLTNRYSRRFTWIVLGVALAAAAIWLVVNPALAAKAFVSVLIVACPCALALAAPLTLGTAQRIFGRAHIFLKNALVLERLAEIDTIVLDKTGTLTGNDAGDLSFTGAPLSGEECGLVRSLAQHSVHPHSLRLARALTAGAASLPVTDFVETAGCGLAGRVGGRTVRLGSAAWLAGSGVAIPADVAPASSSVWVAVEGQFRGCFRLTSPLRLEVDALVRSLGHRYQLALLSGDNAREEARFRTLFGERATLLFGQGPADKLRFIRDLQHAGRKVMMVGDGLNDAGALKQSDVGVAVVEQVGAFSPASDIILDAAQLPQLARMLAFSRLAVRIIRAGFILSGLYNLVGIGIAAAGLLSPIVCAVLMPLSSVSVVVFVCGATRWAARRAGLTEAPDSTPAPVTA
jgi:Cu+-exporting ATPase